LKNYLEFVRGFLAAAKARAIVEKASRKQARRKKPLGSVREGSVSAQKIQHIRSRA
jgi:hypothetical protein